MGAYEVCLSPAQHLLTLHSTIIIMTKLILVAILAAAVVSVCSGQGHGAGGGPPPTFQCEEDGFFADYYRGCQIFNVCKAGVKSTYGCERNLCFNEAVRSSQPCEMVDCPYPQA